MWHLRGFFAVDFTRNQRHSTLGKPHLITLAANLLSSHVTRHVAVKCPSTWPAARIRFACPNVPKRKIDASKVVEIVRPKKKFVSSKKYKLSFCHWKRISSFPKENSQAGRRRFDPGRPLQTFDYARLFSIPANWTLRRQRSRSGGHM